MQQDGAPIRATEITSVHRLCIVRSSLAAVTAYVVSGFTFSISMR